jgi:hypothetical protein
VAMQTHFSGNNESWFKIRGRFLEKFDWFLSCARNQTPVTRNITFWRGWTLRCIRTLGKARACGRQTASSACSACETTRRTVPATRGAAPDAKEEEIMQMCPRKH